MINMTELEKEAITCLIVNHFRSENLAREVVESLVIKDRKMSEDISDRRSCVGFYTNFETNCLLGNRDNLIHHISFHAQRNGLETGADFILFLGSAGEIKFLEASFYGRSLPIDEIMSKDHSFEFKS